MYILVLMSLASSFRYSVRDNLCIESVDQTIEELKLFKAAGGSTIVDVTSIGIRQVRNDYNMSQHQ